MPSSRRDSFSDTIGEILSPSACFDEAATWYKAKYVEPRDNFVFEYKSGGRTVWESIPFVRPTCHRFFTRPHAYQVNEILKLYEDLNKRGKVIPREEPTFTCIRSSEEQGGEQVVAIKGITSRLDQRLASSKQKDKCPYEQSRAPSYQQHTLDEEDTALLVEFAQKILFVANHEGLLNPPSTPGLIVGGLADLNRALFGDALTDYKFSPYRLIQLDALDSKRVQYVRVLQAVGNSILFAVNELSERDQHKERMAKKKPVEVSAANAVRVKDPEDIVATLLTELRTQEQAWKVKYEEARKGIEAITGLLTPQQHKARNQGVEEIRIALTNDRIEALVRQWGQHRAFNSINEFMRELTSKLTLGQSSTAKSFLENSETANGFETYRETQELPPLPAFPADLLGNFSSYIDYRLEPVKRLDELMARERESKEMEKDHATAYSKILEMKGAVLLRAKQIHPFVSTSSISSFFVEALDKTAKEKAESDRSPYFTAKMRLQSLPVPPDKHPLNLDDYKSPLDVMDRIIAELRQAHIDKVEQFGKDSPAATRASEALKNAYDHRAGMIYLRPASAYLRTSFPSTSLQDDPNLAWDNILLQQGIRSLPFAGQLRDILDPIQRQDRVLTAELDKQYWQNINRVRVAGAGLTNQVVAKDDVGNWYVKQYYGDTESIAKAAKSMALFSLGNKLPIDVSAALKKINTSIEPKKFEPINDARATSPPPSPEQKDPSTTDLPPLTRLFGKHRTAYEAKTAETLTTLQALHTNGGKSPMKDQIVTAWETKGALNESKMKELKAALDSAIHNWDSATSIRDAKPGQDSGLLILKDLRALATMGTSLAKKIDELPGSSSDPWDPKEKQDMVVVARETIGLKIHDLLTERQRAIAAYEQAVVFIGEASNHKDVSAEKDIKATP